MKINKVDRKKLKGMVVDILSKSPTFSLLSGADEVNPFLVSFDGKEYYVYVKNLSPAYFENPDVWRIQLPIREDFNRLRESDIPFIALGYDDANKVFTTWNPYWVKQRLNAAKSVSLYSRLSFQQVTRESQQLQIKNLNNDGVVVAFPVSNLSHYLVNVKQFFPEATDYVAIGSKKRTEANAAYRRLCDVANLAGFASFLHDAKGLLSPTINNYCRAVRKLINEGYFSRNRRIFLACDSLAEYPNAVKPFIAVPEVTVLNEVWHNIFSAALKAYIQYLIESSRLSGENDNAEDEQQDNMPFTTGTGNELQVSENGGDVDWEAMYTDSCGKLTKIANPQLIDLLRPVLDTEYRKLSAAYRIVSEFYPDRFQDTMELKDWNALFKAIDWQSPRRKSS